MTTHIVDEDICGREFRVVKPFRGRVWEFAVSYYDMAMERHEDVRSDTQRVAYAMRPLMRHEIPQELLAWSFPSSQSQTDCAPSPWNKPRVTLGFDRGEGPDTHTIAVFRRLT